MAKKSYFIVGRHSDGILSEYVKAPDAEFAEKYFREIMHPEYAFTSVRIEER